MGAYHTLDLELNRKFTLGKHEWDSVTLDRIGTLFKGHNIHVAEILLSFVLNTNKTINQSIKKITSHSSYRIHSKLVMSIFKEPKIMLQIDNSRINVIGHLH